MHQRIGDKIKDNYQCALVQLISMPSQYKLVHNRVTKRDPRWISNGTFCAIANIWKALWQHKKVNDVTSWTLCCFICLKKTPNRTLNGVKNILREHCNCSFHNNAFLQGIFSSLLKFMFSSLSIWHYIVSIKSTVKILSIFVAFLENTNLPCWKSRAFWTGCWTGLDRLLNGFMDRFLDRF